MGEEALRRKFLDCAARAKKPICPERLEQLYGTILHLEELEDMNGLFDLL